MPIDLPSPFFAQEAAVVAPAAPATRPAPSLADDRLALCLEAVRTDPATALATQKAIRRFAAEEPTVLLPAHDPEGPARLAAGAVLS